jgi:hypothetical protein
MQAYRETKKQKEKTKGGCPGTERGRRSLGSGRYDGQTDAENNCNVCVLELAASPRYTHRTVSSVAALDQLRGVGRNRCLHGSCLWAAQPTDRTQLIRASAPSKAAQQKKQQGKKKNKKNIYSALGVQAAMWLCGNLIAIPCIGICGMRHHRSSLCDASDFTRFNEYY